MKNIKWENKFSHETGYVGTISKAKGYFVNADKEGARKFRSAKEIEAAMATLEEFGEFENNDFSVEEA